MKRSMYSLILTDDIIQAIDCLASKQGTSRSNYINQILANHICFVTPEQRMQQFFTCLIDQMERMQGIFRIQEQGSNAILSIFGTVQYRYRPNIRYQIELIREMQNEIVGQLKISCRTQSKTLLSAMNDFFQFWIQLEQREDPTDMRVEELYTVRNGRMTRLMLRRGMTDDTVLGEAVGAYIQMFHSILQSYFIGLQNEIPDFILRHTLTMQYRAMLSQQIQHL